LICFVLYNLEMYKI